MQPRSYHPFPAPGLPPAAPNPPPLDPCTSFKPFVPHSTPRGGNGGSGGGGSWSSGGPWDETPYGGRSDDGWAYRALCALCLLQAAGFVVSELSPEPLPKAALCR